MGGRGCMQGGHGGGMPAGPPSSAQQRTAAPGAHPQGGGTGEVFVENCGIERAKLLRAGGAMAAPRGRRAVLALRLKFKEVAESGGWQSQLGVPRWAGGDALC